MKNKEDLKWGPIAQGFYNALLWATVVVGFAFPQWLLYYLLFLVFMGLGLRPLLSVLGHGDGGKQLSNDARKSPGSSGMPSIGASV